MNYEEFAKEVKDRNQTLCLECFSRNRESFNVKKETTISKNLERIFNSAIAISNAKGFHAMSMRDLSKEVNLSIGALYNYFSSKDELLEMMQEQRRLIATQTMSAAIEGQTDPADKLRVAIRTHLYLSEAMQPWYYFSYMETKNLSRKERQAAIESELRSEQRFIEILEAGRSLGKFNLLDCQMAASLLKAMLQDWFLKRAKYARRGISVDQYADFLIAFMERYLDCDLQFSGSAIESGDTTPTLT